MDPCLHSVCWSLVVGIGVLLMLWLMTVVCLEQSELRLVEVTGLGICGHWTQTGVVGDGVL